MKKKKKNNKAKSVLLMLIILSVISVFSVRAVFGLKSEIETAASNDPPAQEWYLTLVNGKNSIPENYSFELTVLDNGRSVDSRIYPALQRMFDDMREEGIYPVVGEGYRTAEEQEQMMKDKVASYINEGYPRKRAEILAENEVAEVGKSEHQLGLAVDINADKSRSDNEEVYAWLAENAYKYGFILRYPADKTKITGIDFEPWHYRYVGKEAAKEIHSRGICLEEYLEKKR